MNKIKTMNDAYLSLLPRVGVVGLRGQFVSSMHSATSFKLQSCTVSSDLTNPKDSIPTVLM